MFWARAISFPLLLAIFFAIIFCPWGGWILSILLPFLLGMAGYEFCKILRQMGLQCFPKTAGILLWFLGVLAAPELKYINGENKLSFIIIGMMIMVLLTFGGLLFAKDRKKYFVEAFTTFGAFTLITLLYMPLVEIYKYDPKYFLYLILVTKMTDTGGYIFGKLSSYLPWGNHKIAPRFSPKKSYEGLAGGMLMSVAAGLILLKYGCSPFGLPLTIVSSILLSLGSFAGDLSESALKREAEIKDSGNWIPGMGGIFDVLDSFIYNGIIFLIFLTFA